MTNLTTTQLARYRHTAERRQSEEARPELKRREAAWQIAAEVATRLRSEFHATKVVVFGSLARETGFTRWSDIDIAVWGLRLEDTFKAMGMAWDISEQFDINLVDVNCSKPSLLVEIERTGIEI